MLIRLAPVLSKILDLGLLAFKPELLLYFRCLRVAKVQLTKPKHSFSLSLLLRQNPNLEELALNGEIPVDALEVLSRVRPSRLKRLDLSSCRFVFDAK